MRIIIFLFLGLIAAGKATSQTLIRESSASSPEAFKFARYGAIPMSLYTGAPNISIDLVSISNGPLQVPFSLSYNPSSVKVNAAPAYVGLGWSLNGGGVITRQMRNFPDEYDTKAGYLYNASVVKNGWYYSGGISKFLDAHIDIEADIFHFNVMGHAGSFYYGPNGWVVNSDDNFIVRVDMDSIIPVSSLSKLVKVNFLNCNETEKYLVYAQLQTPVLSRFRLIDSKGNIYDFGGRNAVELSANYFKHSSSRLSSASFMLNKVTDPTGQFEIDFQYKEGPPIVDLSYSFRSVESGISNSDPTFSIELSPLDGPMTFPRYLTRVVAGKKTLSFMSSVSSEEPYSSDNLSTAKINDNRCDYKYINGIPIDAIKWEKLDSIQYSVAGEIKEEVKLEYRQTLNRSFLSSLSRNGTSGSRIPPYAFKYNESFVFPQYRTCPGDHWGFYNGEGDNYKIIINIAPYTIHEPKAKFAKTGLLEEIQYPTGGKTTFEWEPNSYSSQLAMNRMSTESYASPKEGGGMRLKQQTDETNGQKLTKTYHYIKGFQPGKANVPSSGILAQPYKYSWTDFNVKDNFGVDGWFSIIGTNNLLDKWCNDPVVCYSEVVEETEAGYKRFRFTSFDKDYFGETHLDTAPFYTNIISASPYIPCSSHELERGKLSSEEWYSKDWKPVFRKTIKYLRDESKFTPFVWTGIRYLGTDGNQVDMVTVFKKFHYQYQPSIITEEHFNGDSNINKKTTGISYNSIGLPLKTEISMSDGSTKIVVNRYASDYCYQHLYDSIQAERESCLTTAQLFEQSCLETCNGESNCMAQCHRNFLNGRDACNAEYYPAKDLLDQNSKSEDLSVLKAMSDRNMVSYPVEELTVTKRDGKEYLIGGWLTKYKDFGTGVIMPWESYKLNLTQPLATYSPAHMCDDGSFVVQPEYAKEASYTFSPKATLTQQEQVGQPIVSYLWDAAGEHPTAKAINAPSGTWLHENFEEGGFNKERQELTVFRTGNASTRACLVDWSNTKTITLAEDREYRLRYWTKKGTSSDQARVSVSKAGLDLIHLMVTPPANGEWMLAEGKFTVPAGQGGEYTVYVLSGGGGGNPDLTRYNYIDEVRIAPSDAQVESYTWELGIRISTKTDTNYDVSSFEYDGLGRLILIKNNDGKVVKAYDYHFGQNN